MSYFLHLHSFYLSLQTMNNYSQSWLICNQHRGSQHIYLTDLSSLSLTACFSILPLNCKCLWAWKCAYCQGGMDPPRVKEVQLLRCVGFADYLHIFNDSSPRRLRALPQLGFFDTVNYSSHLIPPPACPQWGHIASSSSVVVWLHLKIAMLCYVYQSSISYCQLTMIIHIRLSACNWNCSKCRVLSGFGPPSPSAADMCGSWLEWQPGSKRKEGDAVIPPLWLPMSHCNAGQWPECVVHSYSFTQPSCGAISTGQMSSRAFQVKLWCWKRYAPQTHKWLSSKHQMLKVSWSCIRCDLDFPVYNAILLHRDYC